MSHRVPAHTARSPGLRRGLAFAAGLVVATSVQAVDSFEHAAVAAHAMLTRLCDDFGGRLTGSPANRGALDQLASELQALGFQPEYSQFKMPGWIRKEDRVELLAPLARPLRVAAIAYTQPEAAFEADVVMIGNTTAADWPDDARGKVGLLSSASPLPMGEVARLAVEHGVRGILVTNREGGGQLLARTGSFLGEPLPLPIFSLAQEEGLWLRRLLARGATVRIRLETTSSCVEVETANLRLTLPGRSPERVVVGAHFDSWDLGQGTMDNGIGVAQLFALAQSLRGRELARTVQLVWFNGEEQGFWGSRHEVKELGDAPVVAMVNLDMVGVPIAVNALGDESMVPALTRWNDARGTQALPLGVQNINWFGSDHTPYQLAGIRAVTFNAPLPRETSRYYHDLADTIDKLPETILRDSTAVIGDLVLALVNDPALAAPRRRSHDETIKLFTTFGLKPRMEAIGCWPFDRPRAR